METTKTKGGQGREVEAKAGLGFEIGVTQKIVDAGPPMFGIIYWIMTASCI